MYEILLFTKSHSAQKLRYSNNKQPFQSFTTHKHDVRIYLLPRVGMDMATLVEATGLYSQLEVMVLICV